MHFCSTDKYFASGSSLLLFTLTYRPIESFVDFSCGASLRSLKRFMGSLKVGKR